MKYILITGACGGMGRKTAEYLSAQGYFVIALDQKTSEAQERIFPIQADITDRTSLHCAFEQVRRVTGRLDAIVHFAGIYMLDSLVEMDPADFERILKINLSGAYLVNQTFLPLLQAGSKIVITTSELAPLHPLPFTGIYAVTKGALDRYAFSLRMELQLLDISVSVLRAGAVDTGMLGVSTDALDRFCAHTQLYSCNAARFKRIVDSVEARHIPPEKIARKAGAILAKKHPKFAYSINRNPLLLLLNILPQRFQFWVISRLLKQ